MDIFPFNTIMVYFILQLLKVENLNLTLALLSLSSGSSPVVLKCSFNPKTTINFVLYHHFITETKDNAQFRSYLHQYLVR